MNRIILPKGLIAFGGSEGIGKTRFTLKLANFLAENEKVLYISYQDYKEKLYDIIIEMDSQINENLEVNTSFDYFNVGSFLEMIKYIEMQKITTLFIDDLDCLGRNKFSEFNENEKDSTIDGLLYLSKHLNISVVFNLILSKSYVSHYFGERGIRVDKPRMRDFDWSRKIVNDCSQIYALHRPAFFGLSQDEDGNSLIDSIEILSLKNENHKEEIFEIDNKKSMIYYNKY
jgi:hypothetical protein